MWVAGPGRSARPASVPDEPARGHELRSARTSLSGDLEELRVVRLRLGAIARQLSGAGRPVGAAEPVRFLLPRGLEGHERVGWTADVEQHVPEQLACGSDRTRR